MTQSAFKTLLLIVGSALGGIVLFIAAIAGLAYFGDFPLHNMVFGDGPTTTVSRAPDVTRSSRFEGATGRWTGDFAKNRDTVLDAGQGRFNGVVTTGGAPTRGVRVRLMLNGSVLSQWGESDSQGAYSIAVPYGTYRVDGYEIDRESADAVLAGKIESPRNGFSSEVAPVSADRSGRAPNLDFVDPVRKALPLGEVSRTQPIVVSWEPYPGAAAYRVQLSEWKGGGEYHGHDMRDVFDPYHAPAVKEPSFNPADHDVELHMGSYYSLTVDAVDASGHTIAMAPSTTTYGRPDFHVID